MPQDARVGVDVGGTFTDLVTVHDGRVEVDKLPSTPAPAEGVLAGLDGLAVAPSAVGFLGHGTTVATNAVLEGTWADTALVTTAGFRDAVEIGRQTRPDIYDFRAEKPAPVVPRDRRYEVPERLDERGRVVEPLDEPAVRELARDLATTDTESVAVATLFAFENPDHERRVRELFREEGVEAAISTSSAVLPEIREYERTVTTALNAGLVPVVDSYVGAVADGAGERGVTAPLRLMGSDGGLVTAASARERPVETLLSGPAAGVRGAAHVAATAGQIPTEEDGSDGDTATDEPSKYTDLLTMDVGGTSCDVSLVRDGEPSVSTETTVGEYPVSVPSVDVHTVGAGGGSIARVDDGGALQVGPASAGADPGPVCYGRGGTEPTVTDAHLLLGRLDPDAFLADTLDTDTDAVRAAFEPLADELGQSVREVAEGVLAVTDAETERALRVVSVERGHDPREFALVAYGGAGPLHATSVAERLGVPRVIVPRAAGVLSALGLLVSDVTYDESVSMVRPFAAVDHAALRARFGELAETGRERLRAADHEGIRLERSLELRYAGQSFELRVPVPDPETTTPESFRETVRGRFHDRHRQRYGHADPETPLELVTVRLRARGVVEPPSLATDDRDGRSGGGATRRACGGLRRSGTRDRGVRPGTSPGRRGVHRAGRRGGR
ncbi:MAG: N-methylhydantoinase A/acetone carboxylase, beta subunit [halophilic archaeon J07HB67]|jgi:N-methylhydantoinase A/acetone carboxylase, beta subunit|nr:MAG: N-methylhydantoinase A/acetone carboxylase, beta subunit [halophilic archaeon J07HB67]